MGNRPRGGGADGEGVEHPPPLSRRVTEDVFPCEQSTTPASRPLTRPPPAPFRGGGQCMAIGSVAVSGGETGFFGEFSPETR